MSRFPRDDETTSPEVREMVNMTLEVIHRRVGSIRSIRHPDPTESVKERLDLIRRRAEVIRRQEE